METQRTEIIISGYTQETFERRLEERFRRVISEMMQGFQRSEQSSKQRPYYDVDGLADFIHLSKSRIYKGTSDGSIPHIKRGGKLLFKHEDIVKWLESGRAVDA